MPPRLLIFDFDGTLADSLPWFLAALDETARRFGFHRPDAAQIEALRGLDSRGIMRALGVPAWKVPAIANDLRRRAAEAPAPPLFPGIETTLARLAEAGVTLAIASSNGSAHIRRALGAALAGRIAHFACDISLFGKAGRFRRILRESGIPAGAAMAVGDELRDIAAAREAGLAAGAVTWGYATAEALRRAGPDAVFEAPGDLARLLMPNPG
jgi:phosphoglycolate phosphatase